jgi:hypothetical protein
LKKNHEAMLRTGAMALAAAGASPAAHAATVQITFNNSFISSTSGNQLVTDFGGDGTPDIEGCSFFGKIVTVGKCGVEHVVSAGFTSDAAFGAPHAFGVVGGMGDLQYTGSASQAGLAGVMFSDVNVNGGAAVFGWLDATATGRFSGEYARIDLHRIIFDDSPEAVVPDGVAHADAAYPEYGAAVPEPSGLGLLALGAGGRLARRRRAMAA